MLRENTKRKTKSIIGVWLKREKMRKSDPNINPNANPTSFRSFQLLSHPFNFLVTLVHVVLIWGLFFFDLKIFLIRKKYKKLNKI